MDGGILHSGTALHLERHLGILDQFLIDPEVEAIHIATPFAGGGDNAVGPAGISVIRFLIVKEVGVEFLCDIAFVAKHEKSGRGGMLLSVGADARSAQIQKKVPAFQNFPRMAGAGEVHPPAAAVDACFVEHIRVHFLEDKYVLSFYGGVPHHGLIRLLGAAAVALPVAAVGAQRIAVHIDRLARALRTGNFDDHDVVAVHLLNEHVLGGQHVCAGLVRVVNDIPDLLDAFLRIRQIHSAEGFVCRFLRAQQDDAAVGVGESGICFLNAFGQAAESLLGLGIASVFFIELDIKPAAQSS